MSANTPAADAPTAHATTAASVAVGPSGEPSAASEPAVTGSSAAAPAHEGNTPVHQSDAAAGATAETFPAAEAPVRTRRSPSALLAPIGSLAVAIGLWYAVSYLLLDPASRFLVPPPITSSRSPSSTGPTCGPCSRPSPSPRRSLSPGSPSPPPSAYRRPS